MKNGPVISEILELIDERRLDEEDDATWEKHISECEHHNITLTKPLKQWEVSDAELEMLDAIWQQHGQKDQWELMEWCHQNCAEWSNITSGRKPIELYQLAKALGKSKEEFVSIAQEADEQDWLNGIFA